MCSLNVIIQSGFFTRFDFLNVEGFWLVLTAGYVLLSAAVFPRFFSGSTYVYTIARTAVGAGILAIPLGPSSSNVTQSVYFIGDVCCFLFFYAFSGSEDGLKSMLKAALAGCEYQLGLCGGRFDHLLHRYLVASQLYSQRELSNVE